MLLAKPEKIDFSAIVDSTIHGLDDLPKGFGPILCDGSGIVENTKFRFFFQQ